MRFYLTLKPRTSDHLLLYIIEHWGYKTLQKARFFVGVENYYDELRENTRGQVSKVLKYSLLTYMSWVCILKHVRIKLQYSHIKKTLATFVIFII